MKNNKLPKTSWLSVKTYIDNPYILDLYIKLRDCFNKVLQNDTYHKQLAQITTMKMSPKTGRMVKKLKGDYQKEIKAITGNPLLGTINHGGEFYNYICDNIMHLIMSHHEQVEIYNCLKQNNFKINDDLYQLFDNNDEIKTHPSHNYLKILKRAKQIPDLPTHKKFIMDFSVDNHQGFEMNSNLKCTLHLRNIWKKNNWKHNGDNANPADITFQLYLPTYVRTTLMTGKIAKPIVYYDFNAKQLVCQVCYEVKIPEHKDYKNILGVDLGKVKLFSAVVLFSDFTLSPEYIPSNELQKLANKAERISNHKDKVYNKIERANSYNLLCQSITNRQIRREVDYKLSCNKLTRIKKNISKLVANEIVATAVKYQCKEIHMENLHWLLNRGGKWDYSQIQKDTQQLALLFGIKVVRINPKYTSERHPLTGELGKPVGRNIVFKDGTAYDRDHLAAQNIALTTSGKKSNFVAELKNDVTCRVHRQKRKSQIRKQLKLAFNKLSRTMEIVMFSVKKDKLTFKGLSLNQLSETAGLCCNVANKGFLRVLRKQNLSY